MTIKVALIGAGSRSFGPATVRDVLLSKPLRARGVRLVLMDLNAGTAARMGRFARFAARKTPGKRAIVETTTRLARALDGADFVVTAIEVDRYKHWAQDFHVPRKYGFRQVYGENGGPGGAFHALRNMVPTVKIAREMERRCPKALLINYTNPETKLCEAVSRLTRTPAVGLCHGVFMGLEQIARILGKPGHEIEYAACGMNHFTWFQTIRDKKTGKDLYPALREAEKTCDWLSAWDEIALSRIMFRRFGLWPSPAANHIGEYVRWAEEFVPADLQYFHDPAEGKAWGKGRQAAFVYSLRSARLERPLRPRAGGKAWKPELAPMHYSGELAVPIMEALACGLMRDLPAVNVPNHGAIPNLPGDMVVEVPATADARGIAPSRLEPLPEAIAAMIRLHASIHKLLVEAFAERSKAKLIQALLLDPTCHSQRAAVELVDEMLALQRPLLPALR